MTGVGPLIGSQLATTDENFWIAAEHKQNSTIHLLNNILKIFTRHYTANHQYIHF